MQQTLFEAGVFALLPYRVTSLRVDSLTFDSRQRATINVSVRTDSLTTRGRHVLRLLVRDSGGNEMTHLTRNVVATGGNWQDVIPFAISESLTGCHITLRDMASGVSVNVPATRVLAGDINGDGKVAIGDLNLLARAWNSTIGGGSFNTLCDLNADNRVTMADVNILALNWGAH